MGTGFSKKKKEARLIQQQISRVQTELHNLEVVGAAGSGLVTVTLTGDGEMKQIKIKPECVDVEDLEGLEILIRAAHEDAHKRLREQSPPLPGLPGFFA
ncbi:putative YbaB family protein [Candidatus Protochlamydia naegleriophila]|uniref:Nucleoid-associated protein PNK_1882 n=1 Tax=Candidatus Protochlamydia naegleriophila TaxID=389348 RepID=A0A0U5ETG0_9BACT|nr:YbaB/EbfC family nucleoid-associated protein [Candidatus Protochlamydia naegleriophila]CUI17488.1 putative YbaB family protein [Candidatus Protochlamydia naegleriophila]